MYSRVDPVIGILLAAEQNASRSLNINTPRADVSPRLGIAFSPDDKTVFRTAFGTFYGTIFRNLGGQMAYPGYDNTVTYHNLGTAIAQPFPLSQGLPIAGPRVCEPLPFSGHFGVYCPGKELNFVLSRQITRARGKLGADL